MAQIYIGEDRDLTYTITDADGGALDVSTWTIEWVLRENLTDAVMTLQYDNDALTGLAFTTDGTDGEIYVSIPRATSPHVATGETRAPRPLVPAPSTREQGEGPFLLFWIPGVTSPAAESRGGEMSSPGPAGPDGPAPTRRSTRGSAGASSCGADRCARAR